MASVSVSGSEIEKERWQVLRLHRSAPSPPPLPGGSSAVESGWSSEDHHHHHQQQQQHWRSFDSSVDAVSFGFVATAILISMFLVMAIFERFLRPNTTSPHPPSPPTSDAVSRRLRRQGDFGSDPAGFHHLELGLNSKLGFPSPKMTVYTKGVSVLMPGEEIPTFIAHPVPVPCPPKRIKWPLCQHNEYWNPNLNPNRNSSNRIMAA